MTKPNAVMILAAGFGTRMGALTRAMPKPLLRANDRALLDHTLDHCTAAGVRRAVINLHYLGDQIRTHLAGRDTPEITFSDEQPEILETGGGVVHALPLLGPAPFYVMNSDAVFAGPNPMDALAASWDPSEMDVLLLLVPRAETVAYTRPGDFFLEGNGLAPRRRGDATTADYVYTGAQIIAPKALAEAPSGPFSMNIVWDRLLSSGRLAATTLPGPWVDVGTPEGLDAATEVLRGTRE
ncbi:MAG: nucleotidyltransferase family protein [Paracoccaceae bacterium]